MNKYNKLSVFRRTFCVLAAFMVLMTCSAYAFVVKDIQVRGVRHVSVGTVLNYLPVQVGENLDEGNTGELIRALYETGFFQNVSLEREGNTLVVVVIERATIGVIQISGNKEIPTDKLKSLLKESGLVKGRVFQRAALEHVALELKQAYVARGRYNVRVETKVSKLKDDRVGISILISEGRVSRIKEIKIVGNQAFAEGELLPQLSLSSSDLFTWYTKKDQYSKPAFDASLESLRAFYLDRGYLKFKIVSSQVMLSPDKKDVYINIHIYEGSQYHFSGFDITGNTVVPKQKMQSLVTIKQGDVFSRKKVTDSISAMGDVLGDAGYGFPQIQTVPKLDETQKTVFITFVVEPGRHVYVRRINFHGNVKTADYVLRNAVRQPEGSLLSLRHIKESERQLRLMTYIKNIDIKTTQVPGTNNQVDLDVSIEEAPTAEATASVGYGSNGPVVNAAFNQYNFMGTGRSVGLAFNASYWGQNYSFNYFNPFFTNTGIGAGFNLYYQTFDPKNLDVASYSNDRFGGDYTLSIPIGEYNSFITGIGYQNLNIKSVGMIQQIQNFVDLYGQHFQEIRFTNGFTRNTYDQLPYPTSGMNQQASVLIAAPANSGSLSYYKTSYLARLYQPIYRGFIFSALGNIAYGNQFNNQGLPNFENMYAGGTAQPGQVRGYESYSLGPKDAFGNALGGNYQVNGSTSLILPYPLSRETIRSSVFVDAGTVYARNTLPAMTANNGGSMRYSTGISLEWRSPFGPLAFSLAKALNPQFMDDTQFFQFSLSSSF